MEQQHSSACQPTYIPSSHWMRPQNCTMPSTLPCTSPKSPPYARDIEFRSCRPHFCTTTNGAFPTQPVGSFPSTIPSTKHASVFGCLVPAFVAPATGVSKSPMTVKSDSKLFAASKKLFCNRRSVVPHDDWTSDIYQEEDDEMPLLGEHLERSWSFESNNLSSETD